MAAIRAKSLQHNRLTASTLRAVNPVLMAAIEGWLFTIFLVATHVHWTKATGQFNPRKTANEAIRREFPQPEIMNES